jgi:hypothetical protein|tara:strand:- start:41 stop:547 length:507 start_codon:yes stop_codon:yes gene_type:complete
MFPTIVVDNFFTDVNKIINLSKTFEYLPPKENEDWIGFRTESIHLKEYELFNSIILKVLNCFFYNKNVSYNNSFIHFHKITPECLKNSKLTDFHQDSDVKLAGVIYLNSNGIENGTTIFKEKNQKQIIISNDINTLVCYDGSKYHGPTTLDVKKERLTMNIFIKGIKI